MMEEPTYEDIDEAGEPINKRKMDLAAREPKNDFEITLLGIVPTRKRFQSTAEHKRARSLFRRMNGTDDGLIFRAFAWRIIQWAKDKNKKANRIAIGVHEAMVAMENEEKFQAFKAKHGAEVLKKKSAQELAETLKGEGVSSLTELYTKRNLNE